MADIFQANGLPVLMGSLPIGDHEKASKIIFEYTPDIPVWAQLPVYREEGMVLQFLPGLPGVSDGDDSEFVDTSGDSFSDDLLHFYEDYMAVSEGKKEIANSRFTLKPDRAKGFFVLMDHMKALQSPPAAVKGQITGPITFATSIKDQNKRAIFYDEQVRDAAVKLLALKARWQVRELKKHGAPAIIFFDEPALAGFGSSEFISVSFEEVLAALNEVVDAVHEEGGLAGIHICANADWSLILDSRADIVSFDAYSYFDRLMLYADKLKSFLNSGRYIAWGLVPTLNIEDIEGETVESLFAQWKEKTGEIEAIGVSKSQIVSQAFISPSCGTGSLSLDHAIRVLELTRGLSQLVRNEN